MPRIFDNIEQQLLPALKETLQVSNRADFCVGYFNLRGWKQIDSYVEKWSGGEGNCCRLLVGMQKLPEYLLRKAFAIDQALGGLDNQTANRLKKDAASEFRKQLALGTPSAEDEAGLRKLSRQIRAKKVIVKLFLRHTLHAKLYLLFRPDPINPSTGYVGSSNLTFAGLAEQGELNVDVLDHDACQKLARWFEDRWNDRWCIDISDELADIIDESWAREDLIPPYHIYLKMAYHLSEEARTGLTEFTIPKQFADKLFEFQVAAVKIAAHHLNRRGGVLIGDVVGLGKTLMATAVARLFEDDFSLESLILCPKNLVEMWEDYREQYGLRGKVLSISRVLNELPQLRRYRLVVIDESHNLRNREGKRYKAIQEYVENNAEHVVLLSATPYNKTYLDLMNQLRLFVPEDRDIGIRPENLLREIGETEFIRRHQCPPRSFAAFEKSEYPDDWRELMRLFMVRRTRSFIKDNYAKEDETNGRKFLKFADGTRSYFPTRVPRRVEFQISDGDKKDQYALLYSQGVVRAINSLNLPRYGLANYIKSEPLSHPNQAEDGVLKDLSRAGKRLMGFCRTGFFKRLESSGWSFLLSIERHILRNYVYLHAIENGLPLPIGTQDAEMLDTRIEDGDSDMQVDLGEENDEFEEPVLALRTEEDFRRRAAEVYSEYASGFKRRFKWLRPDLFVDELGEHLHEDVSQLLKILKKCGSWDATSDMKLAALEELLRKKHPREKVIVFTQFADTVDYLVRELQNRGVDHMEGITGSSANPTVVAWRFSPESNNKRKRISPENELRVVISTDILSEGQNLQDGYIVVNYDIPWALIRLVQRAGRVDRIGQQSEQILCYSFMPADGVERIIRLRARLRNRLRQNAEIVGSDEQYFDDDRNDQAVRDLYTEKAGILDGDEDAEVDLTSYAYQVWKNATDLDSSLEKTIPALPNVVYSTRGHEPTEDSPEGALLYVRVGDSDALAWIDREGNSVTESQFAVLKAAQCSPDTPALPRMEEHHELVRKGVKTIAAEERSVGGQLGSPRGARFRTYERLKRYAEEVKGQLFDTEELSRAIEEIYRFPLRPVAKDTLNRQLRSGINDMELAELVMVLRAEGRLCTVQDGEEQPNEPQIICSLGLKRPE